MKPIDFYTDTVCNNDISSFDSGYSVFNDYLHYRDDSSVIHYILDSESENLIAYFSLLSSALLYGELSHLGAIPAIELKMFALDKRYQGRGISTLLIDSVIETITHYSAEYVGAKIILLYSVPIDSILNFYEESGFRRTNGLFATYKSPFNEGCIPMFKLL